MAKEKIDFEKLKEERFDPDKYAEQMKAYWQERARYTADMVDNNTAELLSKVKTVWHDRQDEIEKEIKAFFADFTGDYEANFQEIMSKLTPKELQDEKILIKKYLQDAVENSQNPDYKNYLENALASKKITKLNALYINIHKELDLINRKQNEYFKRSMSDLYENQYYHSIYDVQKNIGLAGDFNMLNTRQIKFAVAQKWDSGKNYADKLKIESKLLSEAMEKSILHGVVAGKNANEVGRDLYEKAFGSGAKKEKGGAFGKCVKIARIEMNYIANASFYEAMEEAEVEKYKFIATFDTATTPTCSELDGKIFELSEKIVGVNYPPITLPPHPCRSTVAPHYELDEIDRKYGVIETRWARDPETGKSITIPADMTYEEWYKEFVEDVKERKKTGKKETMKKKTEKKKAENKKTEKKK